MIIEGFEIENWACIKKLTVHDLPQTGVIVMHGPNRTGKSSLVKALRSCLMDYASSTTALKSSNPRGTGEKPMVRVTFSVNGATYRIIKCFGSSKSELASRTASGAWKVETTSATEAHRRVCELVGGDDSSKGLRQLLWLTQAEFQLPDPKKFDAGVQAQLRGILGVLQTPLDDRFIQRVKERWSVWHTGHRKAGKQKIKDSCHLADKLSRLEKAQEDLNDCEEKYRAIEALLQQCDELATSRFDIERQLGERVSELRQSQEERKRSQTRVAAHGQAEAKHSDANNELKAAQEERRLRGEAAQRLSDAEKEVAPAQTELNLVEQCSQTLIKQQKQRKRKLATEREIQRKLQKQAGRVAAQLQRLDDAKNLNDANDVLGRAREIENALADIKQYVTDHPLPTSKDFEALKLNRKRVVELFAERDAASMTLTVLPNAEAAAAYVAVDGTPPQSVDSASSAFVVRHRAELHISNWGRLEFNRESGKGDLLAIEEALQQLEEEFAAAMARLGISASDPQALEQLIQRQAEHRVKETHRATLTQDFEKIAPNKLQPLQRKVLELETKLKGVVPTESFDGDLLPNERSELDELKDSLDERILEQTTVVTELEGEIETAENADVAADISLTQAKMELATREATSRSRREELDRHRSDDEIGQRITAAEGQLIDAENALRETALTDKEATIDERITTCNVAVKALDDQLHEIDKKYNTIRGRLEGSEGLYAQRTSLAARVAELSQLADMETLEKDAVDLLYALFEECREKQLGALMGPIHDRVLSWMRILNLGDYSHVRFGDSFLPDALIRRDGTAEFAIDEESTGTQEQLGILVRLALGSILTTAGQPTVAIFDDPLTHCDIGRLNKMRGILRRASEGDANMTPQAGPLQIIVLTCHPEWFRDQSARVIDLADTDVMQRFPVNNHPDV